MKFKLLQIFSAVLISGVSLCTYAQTSNQIIIANGGVFGQEGNQVTIGAYDPQTSVYGVFDAFDGSFANNVLVAPPFAYVTANGLLIKYNIDTYKKLAVAAVPGSNSMAIYNNQIIVTRGFGAESDYLQVYDTDDLSLDYSIGIADIPGRTSGVVVVGDSAYVSMNSVDTGGIAIINLQTETFVKIIDLDTLGAGIGNLYANNGYIYSVNSIAFNSDFGTITAYDIAADTFKTTKFETKLSGGIGLKQDTLFLTIGGSGIGAIDLSSMSITDTTLVSGFFAAGVYNELTDNTYLTTTDYSSFGNITVYDGQFMEIQSEAIGISPEGIGVDDRPRLSNKQPIANDDFLLVPYNTSSQIALLNNDFDLDQNKLSVNIITDVNFGTTQIADDIITYTPDNDFVGMDTLIYTACDDIGSGLCDTAMVIFTVTEENFAPVANNDEVTINKNDSVLIAVLANDLDSNNNMLNTSILTMPESGIAILINNDTIKYISEHDFVGTDSFTYRICDDGFPALCDDAKVYVIVGAETGFDGVSSTQKLILFPNPVTDKLEVRFVNEVKGTSLVTFMNINGQIIYQDSMKGNKRIDMNNFSQGTYLLNIQSDNHYYQQKVVKH